MFTIELKINKDTKSVIRAFNVTEKWGGKYGKGEQIYAIGKDFGGQERHIKHNWKDGMFKLAIKMLKAEHEYEEVSKETWAEIMHEEIMNHE